MQRRTFLAAMTAPLVIAGAPALSERMRVEGSERQRVEGPAPRKGRLKQGVTRGVFGRNVSLEDCCREAAKLGIEGFDLIGPADWPMLK
jgi:hydroxypyruvate isomerase